MGYRIPEGFPDDLSEGELRDAVRGIIESLRERWGDKDIGGWAPELQLALVVLAISDRSRRQLVTAGRLAAVSLLVAMAAFVVALVR